MKPFRFIVTVEVERVEGKFASRDTIREAIQEELEASDVQTIDTDDGGSYETTSWQVEEA